jgi:hypothetical protein
VAFLQGLEFFEGQRIDRAHKAEVAFEFASSASGGCAFGEFGAFAGNRHIGFAVEIASERFDCRFDSHFDFCVIDFGSLQTFAHFAKTAFLIGTLATKPIESTGNTASSLGLLTTTLTEIVQTTFDESRAVLDKR